MEKKQAAGMAKETIWKVIIELGEMIGSAELPEDVIDSIELYREELKIAADMI